MDHFILLLVIVFCSVIGCANVATDNVEVTVLHGEQCVNVLLVAISMQAYVCMAKTPLTLLSLCKISVWIHLKYFKQCLDYPKRA